MAVTVALRDIVDALELTADEVHHYLNKITGDLAMVNDEEIRAIENDDDWSNYPEWEHEALELAQKILETSDNLALPSKFEIHDYKIMESFCYSIETHG